MGKRIPSQRRGRGGSTFTSPSHKHKAASQLPKVHRATGTVEELYHNPGHTVPFAKVRLEEGKVIDLPAADGLAVGQTIEIGDGVARPGNILPVGRVPEGTPLFLIESRPGDGGKFVRTGGNTARVVTSNPKEVTIQLPSGAFKRFHPACRAIVGVAAGGGHLEKPITKAGKAHHKYKARARYWPTTRGVAKNPVDHPFGGGNKQHTGKPKTVGKGTPPGRKVGSIRAKRTGRK